MTTRPARDDDPTLGIYERDAHRYEADRVPTHSGMAVELGARARRNGRLPIIDLGCGPGWHTTDLGEGGIALDGAFAMLELVANHAPGVPRVQADLHALPFRRGGIGGCLASKSYVHLDRTAIPLALADLHRSLAVGAPASFVLFGGDLDHGELDDDDYPGRRFSLWDETLLRFVLEGAGFTIDGFGSVTRRRLYQRIDVTTTRARTLADTVGPGMRMLLVGLNPSVYSADVGSGFARPGNRFWPAALEAGIVSRARDPRHALEHHGVGMTDLVKRATPRAAELTADEYRHGIERLSRLASWLEPQVVCIIGLSGWRAAVDRKAVTGVQPEPLGGRPVYLMPNPSGLNAHTNVADLADHLRRAAALTR